MGVKILCSGPPAELEKIKPLNTRLSDQIKIVELDSGALNLKSFPKGTQDTHVTILPEFVVPAGRMDEFKAGFPKFYAATKNGPGGAGCLYYGFGIAEDPSRLKLPRMAFPCGRMRLSGRTSPLALPSCGGQLQDDPQPRIQAAQVHPGELSLRRFPDKDQHIQALHRQEQQELPPP